LAFLESINREVRGCLKIHKKQQAMDLQASWRHGMFGSNNLEQVCGRNSSSTRKRQDLVRTPSALWIWCLPIGFVIFAIVMWNGHQLPFTLTGVIVTIATAWIGVACYLHGRRCGRTHCKILGILLPLLSLVGLFNLLGVTAFSWNVYSDAFWIILLISFVPEFFALNYLPKKDGA
jgi:hypothetical protein